MSIFDSILRDLRERRLWPVALVMIVALVAVPVLLSKSGRAATPPPVTPPLAATTNPGTAVPAVSVRTVPLHSRLTGHARDPFSQPKQAGGAAKVATVAQPATTPGAATTPTTSSTTATTTTSHSTTTAGGSPSGSGGSGSGSGSTPTTPTTPTTPKTPTFPTAPRKPAPTGLRATQSYHVTLAMANSAGGLDISDPLERLSIIPNAQEPLLVELGVLKGGHRVLFAVEPQTVLGGPGKCTPRPVDCEILSLAPGQIEHLSVALPTGILAVRAFAVTGIKADWHTSVAAAYRARRRESAAGRRLLNRSSLRALSLFAYRPSLGAVVDLRSLDRG